jgi:Skp family chaperone for outer membrane proteins
MKTKILSILLIFTLLIQYSFSQKSERIGIIDMEYILSKMEDYTIASQQLEEKNWRVEKGNRFKIKVY